MMVGSFSSIPLAPSAFGLCSLSTHSVVCGLLPASCWESATTSAGSRQKITWWSPCSFRLAVVVTVESLKMVLLKTELKVKEVPNRDSCTRDLGQCVGTIEDGSLGGFRGGRSSGSAFSGSGCGFSAPGSSGLLFPFETWAWGESLLTPSLQSLLTLQRRDEPSAVDMTLLARGRLFCGLAPLTLLCFPSGEEKQLRQPDIEEDLPWTYNTVIGEQAKALVVSSVLVPDLDPISPIPVFILTVPAESDERRVIFPPDPFRMLLVPLVSQKSCAIARCFCLGSGWSSKVWLSLKLGLFGAFSLCRGVEVLQGCW